MITMAIHTIKIMLCMVVERLKRAMITLLLRRINNSIVGITGILAELLRLHSMRVEDIMLMPASAAQVVTMKV